MLREVSWPVAGHQPWAIRSDCRTLPAVQTRYLIIAALVTALVILGASLVWLLMGVL